ncbi:hypothetical protein BDN72DRAFT_850297, partial [Pluteus cervinus]
TMAWFEVSTYETTLRQLAPNLRSLVIWNQFSGQFSLHIYLKLESYLSSNQLTALSISKSVGFLLTIFYHLPSLLQLRLHASTLVGFSTVDGTPEFEPVSTWSQSSRPKLRYLSIEDASAEQMNVLKWFMDPICAFDVSELKTFHALELTKDGESIAAYSICQTFVKFISSSLQNLALDPSTGVLLDAKWFKFDPIPQLHSIKLSLQHDPFPFRNFLPWTADVLASLSHSEKLEYLDIPCTFAGEHGHGIRLDSSQGWYALDNVLLSRRFSNLKGVTFGVVTAGAMTSERERLSTIVEAIPKLLPGLSDRGVLTVTNSPILGYVSSRDCWYAL